MTRLIPSAIFFLFCWNIEFFSPIDSESYCDISRGHDAQLGPRRYRPRSPLYRDWSGRNKRCSRQGFVPHLHNGPFARIGWPLETFQAPRRSFYPSFFSPRGPLFPLFPARTFVSICSTSRRNGIFSLTSLAPFSFLAFIFIIIIVVIRISIFTTGRRFFVSVQCIIIIINIKEVCMLLRTLRFIMLYLSQTESVLPEREIRERESRKSHLI